MTEFKKPQRYVPGPGEPALPPQLVQLSDKTADDVMGELNRLPFFMTELDETDGDGGENLELEALKALAYDGDPDEVASNFKRQGNDQFKIKLWNNAVEYYNKGIAVKCDLDSINASLYLNRSAANLELKNYRRCINDAKLSLKYDPKNIKAYYRMAKAFFSIEKFDEAKQALEFGARFDPDNKASKALLETITKKEDSLRLIALKKEKERLEKEQKEQLQKEAISLRNFTIIKTSRPTELLADAKVSLEDPLDIETQLIFPAMIIYPTIDEFDFVAEVSELTTPIDIMETVLQRPQEWFEDPKHTNFTPKRLDAYMETEQGGLIKVGKKATLNKALGNAAPKIPLFDNALRIYIVPRIDAEAWLSKWDKETALEKRK